MSKKLFIGNLDWGVVDEDLRQLLSEFGELEEVVVATDRMSGRSRGFGFATFKDDAAADKAIEKCNGLELKGRKIVVNVARPPKPRQF